MKSENDNATTLILAGDGYDLTIAPEAEARKLELLAKAGEVKLVTNNDESSDAQFVSRNLAAMRIEVEKSRKLVKEPVNRIGKLIDSTAKTFLAELEAEEKRITRLVGDHASEVARVKREKELEEARAFEEARAAREAAERAAAQADAAKAGQRSVAEIAAARQAEKEAEAERVATLAARMEASASVAETKIAEGVRFAWDFEVEDIEILYGCNRSLVEVTPKRAAILAAIKDVEAEGMDAIKHFGLQGIRAFKKPVVSSR